MQAAAQSMSRKTTSAGLGVLALLFIALGVYTTAEGLIEFGPMQQSLCSEIPSVNRIAHVEVFLFRILCFSSGALIVAGLLMWERIISSSLVGRISAHKVGHSSIRSESIAPFNASFVILLSCLILAGLYIRWGPSMFTAELQHAVAREDGMLEWAQMCIFLLCSIFFGVLSFRLSGPKSYKIMYRLFAVGFFLMAGEEISWGQRLLGIETPDVLKAINVQDEINLHNSLGYLADHLFVVAVLAYGSVFPVIAHMSPFFRKLFDKLGLPLPTLGLAVGFLLVSMVHVWTVGWICPARVPILPIAELREFLTAIAFGLLAYEACRLAESRDNPSGTKGTNR